MRRPDDTWDPGGPLEFGQMVTMYGVSPTPEPWPGTPQPLGGGGFPRPPLTIDPGLSAENVRLAARVAELEAEVARLKACLAVALGIK